MIVVVDVVINAVGGGLAVVAARAAVDCCRSWWLDEKHAILTTRTTSDDVPAAAQINAQLSLEEESKEAESHAVLHNDGGQKVYQASWSSQARAVVKHGTTLSTGCSLAGARLSPTARVFPLQCVRDRAR